MTDGYKAFPRIGDAVAVAAADNSPVEPLTVECLRCGQARGFSPGPWRYEEGGACPRCEYVGGAFSGDLTERTRRLFRELPLERRFRLRTI